MRTRKAIIAFAILGGSLFSAQATNLIDLIDLKDQSTTEIRKDKIVVPKHG